MQINISYYNYQDDQDASGLVYYQAYLNDVGYYREPAYAEMLMLFNADPNVPEEARVFLDSLKYKRNIGTLVFDTIALAADNNYLYYVLWRLYQEYKIWIRAPNVIYSDNAFRIARARNPPGRRRLEDAYFDEKFFPVLVEPPQVFVRNYITTDPNYPDAVANPRNDVPIAQKYGYFRPLHVNPILRRADYAPSLHNINMLRRYENGTPIEYWGTLSRGSVGFLTNELPQYASWNPRSEKLHIVRFGSANTSTVNGREACKWVKQKLMPSGEYIDDNSGTIRMYPPTDERGEDVGHRKYELRNGMFDLVVQNTTLLDIEGGGAQEINYDVVMGIIDQHIFNNVVGYAETKSLLVPLTAIEMMLRSENETEFDKLSVPSHIYSADSWRSIREFIKHVRRQLGSPLLSAVDYAILIWALFTKFLYPVGYTTFYFWNENFVDG